MKNIVTQNRVPNSSIRAPIFHEPNYSQRQPKPGPNFANSGPNFAVPANINFALQTSILSHFHNKNSKRLKLKFEISFFLRLKLVS